MGRVWLEAATLAHGRRALLLIAEQSDLEKKQTPVVDESMMRSVEFHFSRGI